MMEVIIHASLSLSLYIYVYCMHIDCRLGGMGPEDYRACGAAEVDNTSLRLAANGGSGAWPPVSKEKKGRVQAT